MIEFKDYGIEIIFGDFGCGKGVVNSILGLQDMHNVDRYNASLTDIEKLENKFNRKFIRPPQQHVTYSNFKLVDGDLEAYDFDPDKFMLPNDDYDYGIFVPWASLHAEEAQSGIFNSYDWSKFPKPALLGFARVRHAKFKLVLDVQDIRNLHTKIREFAYLYMTPILLDHKTNCFNAIYHTDVYLGLFTDYDKAVEYYKTKNFDLIQDIKILPFDGCIYDHYDSFGKMDEFYDVPNNVDFIYKKIKEKLNIKNSIDIDGVVNVC